MTDKESWAFHPDHTKCRCPTCKERRNMVRWHIPTILRWIDDNRTATHTPGGDLVGVVLRRAAEIIEHRTGGAR